MMLSCKLQQYLFLIPLLPRIAVSACAYFAIRRSFVCGEGAFATTATAAAAAAASASLVFWLSCLLVACVAL